VAAPSVPPGTETKRLEGLTDEWHPTQMLADFLTMHEASGKPYDELTYAFVGDCRFKHGALPAGHGGTDGR